MIMWFGFDWQSKAAVAPIMTFFQMLVNTLAALHVSSSMSTISCIRHAADTIEHSSRCASAMALPFIFNTLQNQRDARIDRRHHRQVFQSPTVGMGFRISTKRHA